MKRIFPLLKRIIMIFLVVIGVFALVVFLFMQQAIFGKAPSGERLKRIEQSPNYKNGAFQNLSHTPALSEGTTYYSVLKEFFFQKSKRRKPLDSLPSKKIDLHSLPADKNILVWFGHSSYFMQLDGKKILIDPVLSGSPSPLSFTTPSFNGSDVYAPADIPAIDYLFLSHDHYDHLDYKTLLELKPRIHKIICGLGVGEHLEYWGFNKNILVEEDWNTEVKLDEGFTTVLLPSRHFSGRGFKRNGSLWVSFVLKTPSQNIYLGGDSGYDTHFATIGNKYGPFDLSILECGQYDKSWKYIHMMPEEVVQAAQDLKTNILLPVHWSKFQLGNHAWDDPIIRVHAAAEKKRQAILTPLIGEAVVLGDSVVANKWWEKVQ